MIKVSTSKQRINKVSCFLEEELFLLTYFEINFFKILFWEYYQNFKLVGSRSGLKFCLSGYGLNCLPKPQANKELISSLVSKIRDLTILSCFDYY